MDIRFSLIDFSGLMDGAVQLATLGLVGFCGFLLWKWIYDMTRVA